MMAFDHCVFTISQHEHKLGALDHCHTIQRIQKVGYWVENVFSSVSFEHWDGDQMQIR
jgi:hypothetical protein